MLKSGCGGTGQSESVWALKTEFATVLAELEKDYEAGKGVDDELLSVIELISIILGGLKGEDANGE